MKLLRLPALAMALLGTAAFAEHHHWHHSSGGDSSSPPVCIKWVNAPVDAGLDAGTDASDDGGDGLDDGGVFAADAGTPLTVRVCAEYAPAFGCSAGGNAGGLAPFVGFAALLLRRRQAAAPVVIP